LGYITTAPGKNRFVENVRVFKAITLNMQIYFKGITLKWLFRGLG